MEAKGLVHEYPRLGPYPKHRGVATLLVAAAEPP